MEALLGVRNDCAADRAPTQWTPDSPAIVRGDVRGFTSDPTTFIFNPLSRSLFVSLALSEVSVVVSIETREQWRTGFNG